MQPEFFNLLLALGMGTILLYGAGVCFRRIDQLMRVDAHHEATRLDRHLPLQGRWLGYLLSVFLFPLAIVALLVGGMILVGGLIGLLGLLFGGK